MQRRSFLAPGEPPGGELVLYEQYRRGCFRVVDYAPWHGLPARERTGKMPVPLITPGMPLAEAQALDPNLHFEEHDPAADLTALEQLALWCERFSPAVGLGPPDNLHLDMTGLAPLFGGEEMLAHQLLRDFQSRGLAIRAAIADTLGLAWGMAHYAVGTQALACRPQAEAWTPTIVPPGQTAAALAELPVAALRISEDVIEILQELGIDRVGRLLEIPPAMLAARFDRPPAVGRGLKDGPSLVERLNQALGLAPELIVPYRPPPEIVVETRLEYPVTQRAALQSLLEHLLGQVVARLAQRQQGAIRLECQLQCDDGRRLDVPVGLYQASAEREHLLELLLLRVERLALPAPLVAMRLAVLLAAPLEWRQRELFEETSAREGRRQLALLIDRLSNRLGREAVVRARLQPDAQPELSVRYEPLTGRLFPPGPRPGGKRRVPLASEVCQWRPRRRHWQTALARATLRPLRLETPPTPLQVLSLAPQGPPLQFCWRGDWRRVARVWGPERIQTGWWRGPYVQRDYYRVETVEGTRFWLFRRLTDAAWFLHGVFD